MVEPAARCGAPAAAIASSAETGTIFKPRANASPCMEAMPTRRPVNEPGPATTASRSTVSSADAGRRERARDVRRQPLAVRRGGVAGQFDQNLLVVEHRRAAGARGGVDGENAQETSGTFCLRCYTPALRHSHASRGHVFSSAVIPAGATPAMRQFFEAKRQYRDAILFFRMGDFYEMFYEDALTAARALELTLTSRAKDASGGAIPMCGVPYHAGDAYIARLVRKGFRVAICEQMEDPKKAKGIVRREVVRVVSPGTLTDAGYLDAREPAFLMAIAPVSPGPGYGAALLDLSTGEFTTAEYAGPDARQALLDELAVLRPREIVAPSDFADAAAMVETLRLTASVTTVEPWTFDSEAARRALLAQLQTQSLFGFGLEGHDAAVSAAGALVQYLRDTQKVDLAHIREISYRAGADYLIVDPTTLRNLNVIESADGGTLRVAAARDRSHGDVDGRPAAAHLAAQAAAVARAHPGSPRRRRGVRVPHAPSAPRCRTRCARVHDMERLVARAALGTAGPRDLVALRQSLAAVPRVRLLVSELRAPLIGSLAAGLDDLADLRQQLEATLRRRAAGAGARRRRDSRRRRRRSSTSCATSAARASGASPRWRRPSAPGPASTR